VVDTSAGDCGKARGMFDYCLFVGGDIGVGCVYELEVQMIIYYYLFFVFRYAKALQRVVGFVVVVVVVVVAAAVVVAAVAAVDVAAVADVAAVVAVDAVDADVADVAAVAVGYVEN